MNNQIIITGSNGTLGKYISIFFLKKGYEMILITRKKNILEKFYKNNYTQYQSKITIFSCDFNNEKSVDLLCSKLRKKIKYPLLLINNAAIHGPVGPLENTNIKLWKKVFNINFFAHLKITKIILKVMLKNNNGSIINIAGGGSVSPRENFNAYSSSKTALIRFSENLSIEYFNEGINFNCISPGILQSSLQKEILKYYKKFVNKKELKKLKITKKQNELNLKKLSNLVSFLISKDGKQISGKIISSKWDNLDYIKKNISKIKSSNYLTLRRII